MTIETALSSLKDKIEAAIVLNENNSIDPPENLLRLRSYLLSYERSSGNSSGNASASKQDQQTLLLETIKSSLATLVLLITPIIENNRFKVSGVAGSGGTDPPPTPTTSPSARFNSNRNTYLIGAI